MFGNDDPLNTVVQFTRETSSEDGYPSSMMKPSNGEDDESVTLATLPVTDESLFGTVDGSVNQRDNSLSPAAAPTRNVARSPNSLARFLGPTRRHVTVESIESLPSIPLETNQTSSYSVAGPGEYGKAKPRGGAGPTSHHSGRSVSYEYPTNDNKHKIESVQSLQIENSGLKKMLSQTKITNKRLEASLHAVKSTSTDAQEKVQAQLSMVMRKTRIARNELGDAKELMADLEKEISELRSSKAGQEEELVGLRSQIPVLEEHIAKALDQRNSNNNEGDFRLKKLLKRIQELNMQVALSKFEKQKASSQSESLQEQVTLYQEQCHSFRLRALDLEQETASTKEQFHSALSAEKVTSRKLQGELQRAHQVEKERKLLCQKYHKLLLDCGNREVALQQETSDLRTRLNIQEQLLNKAKATQEADQKGMAALRQGNGVLRQDLEKRDELARTLEHDLEQALSRRNMLQKSLEEAQRQTKHAMLSQVREIEVLKRQTTDMRDQLETRNREIRTLQATVSSLEKEKDSIVQDICKANGIMDTTILSGSFFGLG